jgi:hypothetical protein
MWVKDCTRLQGNPGICPVKARSFLLFPSERTYVMPLPVSITINGVATPLSDDSHARQAGRFR